MEEETIDKYILVEMAEKTPGVLAEIDVLKFYDRLSDGDKSRVNIALTNLIASKFEDRFGKFLNKKLYQLNRKVEIAKLLKELERGNSNVRDRLYNSIGMIAIDYYENTIRRGFFKESLSGNKNLDRIYGRLVEKMFDNPNVIEFFKNNIEEVLDRKLKGVFADPEYKKLVGEDVVHNLKSRLHRSLGGRETKFRWEVLDKILRHLPGIAPQLRKVIKKDVFMASYPTLVAFAKRNKISELSVVLSDPLLEYMFVASKKRVLGKYYDSMLVKFIDTLGEMMKKPESKKFFAQELEEYLSYVK